MNWESGISARRRQMQRFSQASPKLVAGGIILRNSLVNEYRTKRSQTVPLYFPQFASDRNGALVFSTILTGGLLGCRTRSKIRAPG
jgi:hypothetical protein